MLNINDLKKSILNNSETETVKREVRYGYDPLGNCHCFNKGFAPAWWDRAKKAVQDVQRNANELFTTAGGDFNVLKGQTVTLLDDGRTIIPDIKTYNLVREDKPEITLQVDVSNTYNLMPYREIVLIPDDVTMKLSDFNDSSLVRKFFIDKHGDDPDVEVQVNEMLYPAGCSVWQDGKQITFQYKIGNIEPVPGDHHNVFLNIESAFDGKKTTRFYLTIVRVVCENTQFHAEQDGWARLMKHEKNAQRIRRSAMMDSRMDGWRNQIGETMLGAVGIEQIFINLAETKIATRETRKDIVIDFMEDLFGLKESKSKRSETRKGKVRDNMIDVMFNREIGGGNCETVYDVWNGITAWNQHFTQVNGKDWSENQKSEKRYYSIQTDKVTQEEINLQFVSLLNFAEKMAG